MNCNHRWQVLATHHYDIQDDGRYAKVAYSNKFCVDCHSHQYGIGSGRFYTRKEWDDWVNSSFTE